MIIDFESNKYGKRKVFIGPKGYLPITPKLRYPEINGTLPSTLPLLDDMKFLYRAKSSKLYIVNSYITNLFKVLFIRELTKLAVKISE
jgi:hypothetical protein